MTLFFHYKFLAHLKSREIEHLPTETFHFPFLFSVPIWIFKMATNEFCPCFPYNRQVSFKQTQHLITLKNKQLTVSGGSLIPLQ